MNYENEIKKYYELLQKTINELDLNEISEAMNIIYKAYQKGVNIYICGNGGSASTASHFANDFNKGISEYLDKKFNFIALTDNIATIMAIANDIGYDDVFSFQLDGHITKDDILIAISGSGNSSNIIKAVEKAHENNATVIGISGYKGGKLKSIANYHMHVDIENMQIVEDIHMTFDHMMMSIFKNQLIKKINK